jgi:hypothetical protein
MTACAYCDYLECRCPEAADDPNVEFVNHEEDQ